MYLSATNESLQVVLGSTVTTNQLEWHCSYQDITSAGMTLPQSSSQGLTNNTTDVDMVAAPAAATTRQVIIINIFNDDTVSQTVIVKKDVGGTETILYEGVLQAGETLYWSRESGWSIIGTPSSTSVTFDVFTANGTWTKPAGLKAAFVFCGGAGGGGGSGRRGAAGSNRFGGGAGQGGALVWQFLAAQSLSSTVAVTIGTVGTGGAGILVDDTNGNGGITGGDTIFGSILYARGGANGNGGTNASGGAGGNNIEQPPTNIAYGPYSLRGATGGQGSTTGPGNGNNGLNGTTGAAAGGGGAGINTTNVSGTAGGIGGSVYQNGLLVAGPNSGATPNGVNNKSIFLHFSDTLTSGTGIGTGGAGGYPTFKDGGNGGYCAGGGGGSGVLNGTASGKGGDGGGGLCIVMNIF